MASSSPSASAAGVRSAGASTPKSNRLMRLAISRKKTTTEVEAKDAEGVPKDQLGFEAAGVLKYGVDAEDAGHRTRIPRMTPG